MSPVQATLVSFLKAIKLVPVPLVFFPLRRRVPLSPPNITLSLSSISSKGIHSPLFIEYSYLYVSVDLVIA